MNSGVCTEGQKLRQCVSGGLLPENRAGRSRIGYTVSNKSAMPSCATASAAACGRFYRLHERQIARGYDLVVVSRVRACTADYHQLEAAFLSACAQLGLLTEGDDGA
ncbi:MAG: ribonuclease P protein component [Oscillospiraceae bacterium]